MREKAAEGSYVMKRTVLCSVLTLVIGFAVGVFFRFHMLPAPSSSSGPSTMNALAASGPSAAPAGFYTPAPSSVALEASLDRDDNGPLLERAGEVTAALRARNYVALAAMVHPEKGVAFTPYSTVNPDGDLCFSPAQLTEAAGRDVPLVWGVSDGKGEPIELTLDGYFDRYVYNADYAQAPEIGIDTVLASGNAMENVAASFPMGRFVEYHFPGLEDANLGYDWCSLKLVFEIWQNQWMLVGVVHSEWTV